MKYLAVSINKDNVLIILVYNTETKSAHSSWTTLQEAQEVAKRLNKEHKVFKDVI